MTYQIHNCSAFDLLPSLKNSVDLIVTSPPYNIGSKAPRNDGMRKEGKYDPKSYGGITGYADSFDEGRYQVDQIRVLNLMAKALKEDGVLVYNHKPRRKNGEMIHPMTWLSRVKGLVLMEEIIWDRGSTHNHSDRMMWPHTERLYVFRKLGGTYRLRNTDNLLFRSVQQMDTPRPFRWFWQKTSFARSAKLATWCVTRILEAAQAVSLR